MLFADAATSDTLIQWGVWAVSLLTALAVVGDRIRKSRADARLKAIAAEKAETAVEADHDENAARRDRTAIDQWRQYAKEREKQHIADIARLETQIAELLRRLDEIAAKERRCLEQSIRQEMRIAHLERVLHVRGIDEETGDHRPLPPKE
jgi:flagellar biosynthesis GTPase FlhF